MATRKSSSDLLVPDASTNVPVTPTDSKERELAGNGQLKMIEKNCFTRWTNEHLKTVNKHVADLAEDLSDGLRLIALVEVLSGKRFLKFNKRRNFITMKLENVTMALKFLEDDEGIKIVNKDSSDIVDHKLKLILGLIWTLILHYSISMPVWDDEEGAPQKQEQTPKQRVLDWIQGKLPDRLVRNFTTVWNDGKAVGALVDEVTTGLCPDWESWNPENNVANATEAMNPDEQWLDVPQLVQPAEMCNPNVDELSMMTYRSQFPSAKLKSDTPFQPKTNPAGVRAFDPGEPVHLLIAKTPLCSRCPAGDLEFQKMFDQVVFQNAKQSRDENLNLTLKTNFENDDGTQEEFSPEALKINVRKAGEYDLLRPIRGARPCQIDNEDKSELSMASDKNLPPSSVITLRDEKDEVVDVANSLNEQALLEGEVPETKDKVKQRKLGCKKIVSSKKKRKDPTCHQKIATMLNVKTSVNCSKVDGNATHPSQEEGEQTTSLKTGLCAIPSLKDGQPTTASQSVGNTKTVNEQALLESEVPETKEEVKQRKLGCKKIVSSRKKKKDPTCRQVNDFGMKLNVTTIFISVLALAGGVHAFKGPENQVAKRAEQTVLRCLSDLGHHVKWFMNRKQVFSGYHWATDVESLFTIADGPSGHYNLSINYAVEKMAGWYTCQQPGELKEITARLIVLDINCSAEETNVTTAVCTAVITGGNVTEIRWQIIHEDGVTNAPGAVVTLIKSDTVDGIQRQKFATALTLTENDLHSNSVCRLTLVFNDTERSAIVLGPEEQMADNIPTYTVDILCNTSKKEPVAENPVSKMPESNQSHDFNLYIGMLVVEMAAVVLIMIASIRCGFPYTQVNGNGVIFAQYDTAKMETSLCSMKIEEVLEETSEIDKRKKLWDSEQVRLKELCCLEDTEPWEINRLARGITSSEEFTDFTPLTYIAGTDISFVKDNKTNACAAIVIVELPSLEVVYEDISIVELTAPYIPGFLAFREADFLIKKLEQLQNSKPDIMPQAIIVDGNGILHPTEFGLACRIGVHMGIPTVIAAKTLNRVDGIKKNEDHQNKVKALLKKGDQFPLVGQSGQTLGVALRSCDKSTLPVYISPGHNISMETAVWLVQLCCKHRIPEPVRQADIKSRQYIQDNRKSDVVCKHDTGKMETSLCSMKTEEEIMEETSEIDKTKKLWESEQVRLKELCCLEDTEPWEINRLARGITSSEEFTDFTPLTYIAGTDISFVKDNETNACAAIVVVELPSLEVVYEDISMVELTAPYIPGFLAFREADFLVKKLEQLQKSKPDLMPQAIIVDGNGILHPREFGLACHIGVHMGIPTVGAAKTLYHVDGIEKNEDHQNKIKALLKRGDQFPLVGQSGQTLGVALRSCDKSTNPIYISPGHNISMETAVWLVQLCCKYRVPEPVRQADIKSRQYIRDNWKSDVA